MDTKLALIGIVVEDTGSVTRINDILHEYGHLVIGRMGLPCRERGVHMISVVLDASGDQISSLAGKLGMVSGVSVKTMVTKNG